MPEGHRFQLVIGSQFDNIELVQVVLNDTLERLGVDGDTCHWVDIAVREAVANAIKGDVFGIGYGGIAYLEGIKALKVKKDDAAPAVAPSLETAQSGSYPISRFLLFYTAGEPTGTTKKFIEWVKGSDGQRVIGDVGYYPLPGATGGPTMPAKVESGADAAK